MRERFPAAQLKADCPHESCRDILFPCCVLGDLAGRIVRSNGGKVKHNDKCRACGAQFADTRQVAPQQALFWF